MCGIAFVYNPDMNQAESFARMEKCLNRLRHRGPDDSGIWQKEDVCIGHRRLSIIDLSASRQPMADPSDRCILSYNGEIYNYQELRAELAGRWHFLTGGDTEVLLAGLILHGRDFIQRLEGMWAFSFWDSASRTLLLCRDRMGKKPLYYQISGRTCICGSELPSLARLATGPWREDLDSTADYLRYGYYLPGTTAYKDVYEVLPGHVLQWSPDKGTRQAPYWRLEPGRFSGSRDQAAKGIRECLVAAVEKRLVADVEVGAFLSGGIDSSLVVSILTRDLEVIPKTFTIGFQEKSYDESAYASQMAEFCGTDHYCQTLSGWDRNVLTDLILNHIGQPFADSSLLPTTLVSRVAADHVKVALSGDGGDELFSGYQRYLARSILRWYTRLPKPLRRGIGAAIRLLPEPVSHHSRSLLKKAHLFQDIIDRMEDETPYIAPLMYSGRLFGELVPDLAEKGHGLINLPEQCGPDDITRMMYADALVYLPQDILLKVDRASMACSLETRAPFLDRQVLELAFSMPRPWHRRGMRGKRMLRSSFSGYLPQNIWQRRKQGFGVPIHGWFRGEAGDELEHLLQSVDSPLVANKVLKLLQQHRSGQRDHGYRLWSIFVYLVWKSRRS
ncbi:asparagine synthase (glutamine-hydrolyzing) [Desulfomarina sp.]